jgi:hypothetical protein
MIRRALVGIVQVVYSSTAGEVEKAKATKILKRSSS